MAGNQVGKTLAGGNEAAMHATGRYPDWWKGKRFDRPTIGWACGVTGEVVRDTVQRVLVGRTGEHGTGAIPKDALVELVSARGTPELARHYSRSAHHRAAHRPSDLRAMHQGREKFQGETLDWVWFDEEPPIDIFHEGTDAHSTSAPTPSGLTFTPLHGCPRSSSGFFTRNRTIAHNDRDDNRRCGSLHRRAARKRLLRSYPAHEREARTEGNSGSRHVVVFSRLLRSRSLGASRFPSALAVGLDWNAILAGPKFRCGGAWSGIVTATPFMCRRTYRLSESNANGSRKRISAHGEKNSLGVAEGRQASNSRRRRHSTVQSSIARQG